MTIRVALHHATSYTFDREVTIHPHTVRLRPAPHSRTPINAYSLTVSPPNHFINWQQDPFGNYLARLVFPEPADHLSITVDLVADMTVINPFDFFVEEYAETYPFAYPTELATDLAPYLAPVPADAASSTAPDEVPDAPAATASPAHDAVDAWIQQRIAPLGVTGGDTRIVDFLVAVNQAVQGDIAYTVRLEPGVQSPGQTLAAALGSCRDSAWLLVSVLRRLGLAARFVSGYLVQLTSDVTPVDGPAGPTADFTDLHAWAEVYIPGAGWVGLDATSGLFAGEGHIPLSATPSPASSAPITGSTGITDVQFAFENTVRRVHEDVRVTKPYSDDQWSGVMRLGEWVDDQLTASDVRLTMGGEPTFVSAGDTSSAQWETAADGPEKRELATRLADRLRTRWAPDGITQHGQGKWYPGEDLPRWQMAIAWRTDGTALWRDASLLADPWGPATLPEDAAASDSLVERFTRELSGRLGIADDLVLPAFEDPWNAALGEARQPAGDPPQLDADPGDPDFATPDARAALVDRLDATAGRPAGWVVPVFVDPEHGGWATTRWRTRRRHLFLTAGTSPLGLRLPLDAIAWGEQPDITHNEDPERRLAYGNPDARAAAARELPIEDAPRTAVATEARDGHLFVFLPPLDALDDAVKLVAAVEGTAAALGVPVVLEGYPLPFDPRLRTITVTPDPGVIEVNVHPTSTWAEAVELTETLYDDARRSGLSTEKFDVDGTHTGTGGGNHITLGGPTPWDSPLLRRPDLLRSLITFWQNHPSLSYVFSGRFIGPTSQAPRVDEARSEYLYELEIAFAELEAMASDPAVDHDVRGAMRADRRWDEDPEERVERQRRSQVWLTDRLLRHLLTDVTGNTHRAEFCIDKLYNPDRGAAGRLGLLEMRGFEMPPHERMALVQQLLVRALVLRFWQEPYSAPLVRWGTRLHDRFLLPSFAAADLRAVVDDLNAHLDGPDFDLAWLEAFLEFRFPRLGEVDVDGVHLELRGALEPWHVLGEEVTAQGTSRFVDSSVERVQVAATGLVPGRHVLTCNGVPVPMVTAGSTGGFTTVSAETALVGGVRFRAWDPPSALHPSIGIHSPLDFDLVDTWNGQSLGGFTYHIVHPGGRSYEDYPVNAAAAETRRASRFTPNRTSGSVDMSAWPSSSSLLSAANGEYPATLDLRRFSRGRPGGGKGTDDA